MVWLTAGLTAAAALVALPTVVIAAQVALASLPRTGRRTQSRVGTSQSIARPTAALLVPAHNEALGIRATIESLLAQMSPGDRVVVIADNCTDETMQVARDCGAEVIERTELTKRGKGY